MAYQKAFASWLFGTLMWVLVPGVKAAQALLPSDTVIALQQIIVSGRFTGMRWPDFRDVQSSVVAVYAQNGYKPLWVENGTLTARGQSILDNLRGSAAKGLNPEDYDVARLTDWASRIHDSGGAARELAALDLSITIDLMRYASALHQGRVDPRQIHFAIRQKDQLDAATFVGNFLLSNESLSDLLAQIEPPFRGYRNTLAVLARTQELAFKEPVKMPVRPRFPLRQGQHYLDIDVLAARLAFLGDLESSPNQGALKTYDGYIVEAVKRFQARHGLPANGTLDALSWQALTTPLSRRVEQLELALERWRWLPSTVKPAIVVNLPEFQLRVFDDNGQIALRMPVIVGKAYRHRTPVFEDDLDAVIIRPWWNVPLSIQRSEMVKLVRANLDYLRKNRLQVVDTSNNAVGSLSQDELLKGLQSGDLRLRQEPGPDNSLGLLKFDFPNDYSVYMHGTPAHQLFSQARRDFSHGCIRVENPEALAEWVLRYDQTWSKEKIAATVNGERTIRIPVSPPVAVLVLYGTAVVEENGEVHFFDDIYGYDRELTKALASGYPYSRPSDTQPDQ
jgi:murein L,D-transpeptidase YcbB/YkuD